MAEKEFWGTPASESQKKERVFSGVVGRRKAGQDPSVV